MRSQRATQGDSVPAENGSFIASMQALAPAITPLVHDDTQGDNDDA